jgi:hypothetical protein
MVKTPKARHSKTKRDPVTIDLDPASVSRVTEEDKTALTPEEIPADAAADAPATSQEPPIEEAADTPTAAEEREWTPRDAEAAEAAEAASARADAEEKRREEGVAVPPPAAQRSGAGTVIAAGIIGAILAVALAGILQWAGVLPSVRASDGGSDVATLRQDVSALQGQVAGLTSGTGEGVSGADLSALSERVDGLETSLASLKDAVSGVQNAQQSAPAAGADVDALKGQIADLQAQVQKLAQSAGNSDLQQRVAQLEQGVAAAKSDAGQVDANAQKLAELQGRLDQLGDKVAAQNEQPAVSKLVAATALKSAVDRGVPFQGELQAYASLSPEAGALDPLQKYAEKGVPTRTELAQQVPVVASRIVAASETGEGGSGFLGRLWDSASSLVVVRPVGQVEGDGVPAIAARFEADVKSGNYDKALAEYGKLPEDAKQAAADFAEKLKARQAADKLLDQALSGALKAG